MTTNQTETEVTTVSNTSPQKVTRTVKSVDAPRSTVSPQHEYNTKKVIFRTYQVIWYILGVLEVLLAFRILLKMLAANPSSGFARLIYGLTDVFALPFYGLFGITVANGSIFEWSTIVAGIVYALLAYGIVQLLQIMKPTNPAEVNESVDIE